MMAEVEKNGNKMDAMDLEKRWGLKISEIYPIALNFFKEKNGSKALTLTYNDRLKMVALTKQALHGKYTPSLLPDNGLFDVVGNNRRQAWQLLGDMSQEEAMCQFVEMLDRLCPLFTHVVEAHKVEKDEAERKRKEEQEEVERQLRMRAEDEMRRKQEVVHKQLSQEALVRNALNQQTYNQFRMYAQLQYPNNSQQQDALIAQLQEQHFIQYMQQVYNQQQITQQQQSQQQQQLSQQQQQQQQLSQQQQQQQQQQFQVTQQQQQQQHRQNLQQPLQNQQQDTTEQSHQQHINQQQQQKLQQQINLQQQQQHQQQLVTQQYNSIQHTTPSTISTTTSTTTLIKCPPVNGIINNTMPTTTVMTSTTTLGGSLTNSNSGININFDTKADNDALQSHNDHLMRIETASLWTRKDIKNFKESLVTERDSTITIGSGELVTVRVPTHADGTCLFWEFATDGYDIGFGVSFEWSVPSNDDQTIPTSNPQPATKTSPTTTMTTTPSSTTPPPPPPSSTTNNNDNAPKKVEVIVPIDRRQSQTEVQCGSHVYPGMGMYLLMFDNSYSLWRSKNIYYRVYYSQ